MKEAKDKTVLIWKNDAFSKYRDEEFKKALEMFNYLKDTLNENTTEINNYIDSCRIYDSLRIIFNENLNLADSLSKTKDLKNFLISDSLYKATLNLKYYFGEKKLNEKIESHQNSKIQIVKNNIEKVKIYIQAGTYMCQYAEDLLKQIEKIDSANSEIDELFKKIEL
jgi:hypothetical protein